MVAGTALGGDMRTRSCLEERLARHGCEMAEVFCGGGVVSSCNLAAVDRGIGLATPALVCVTGFPPTAEVGWHWEKQLSTFETQLADSLGRLGPSAAR